MFAIVLNIYCLLSIIFTVYVSVHVSESVYVCLWTDSYASRGILRTSLTSTTKVNTFCSIPSIHSSFHSSVRPFICSDPFCYYAAVQIVITIKSRISYVCVCIYVNVCLYVCVYVNRWMYVCMWLYVIYFDKNFQFNYCFYYLIICFLHLTILNHRCLKFVDKMRLINVKYTQTLYSLKVR